MLGITPNVQVPAGPGEPSRSARRRSFIGYYARQMTAIQRTRVATSNRIKAMRRDHIAEPWLAPQLKILDDLKAVEALCLRQLTRYGQQHFMAEWIDDTPGISHAGLARVIGAVGDLDDFPTAAHLWSYMGFGVVAGCAPRRVHGVPTGWSQDAKWLSLQIGESVVRVNRGPYRAHYDRKKAEYVRDRPDWSDLHRHRAAVRYLVKMLLRDMWREWRKRRGDPLPDS